jgi:hypothetical protein
LIDDQNCVDPSAHSWNIEFEKYRTADAMELRLEYRDLGKPGFALSGDQSEIAMGC